MSCIAFLLRALVLLPLADQARAQVAADQPDEREEIIVVGRSLPLPPGTPAYGSVLIDRERLINSASNLLENVLTDVAGFQQFRRSDSRSANPSAQGATLRALGGNASSRALVLLDGVPMADPFFGYIPFNALAPDRLSTVRVTRGGGSGAFGAGAVAGTIELASAERRDLPRLSASAFYGTDDATELTGGLTQDLGQGFVSLTGRWDRGDGFQTTPRDQRVAATVPAAYDGWSVGLRGVVPLAPKVELQVRGLAFRDQRTLRFAGADSMSQGQDVSTRLIVRGPWKVDALAYLQLRNFSNVVVSSTTFNKALDQRDTPSTGIGGKIEVRPLVGKSHLLRLGLDTRFNRGDMYEDAFNAVSGAVTARRHAGGKQNITGLFVEDDWSLGRLVLTGGVRADHWTITRGFFDARDTGRALVAGTEFADRRKWQVNGRAGVLWHALEGVDLRAAAYTGFRLPTLNELYRPFTVFPVTTQANAALAPEKLKGAEVGIDVEPAAGVTLAATVFHNRLGDAIANVTLGPNLRRRQNVKAIVAKGVELTARARLADFLLSGSYAYSHSRVDAPGEALDGLIPAQSPRHAASATISWQKRSGPGLSATVRYVGKQYEDDLQTDALPGVIIFDAVAGLPLGRGMTLVGRAENLFDAKVITRNVAGSIDLGAPRTLWVGLRFAH